MKRRDEKICIKVHIKSQQISFKKYVLRCYERDVWEESKFLAPAAINVDKTLIVFKRRFYAAALGFLMFDVSSKLTPPMASTKSWRFGSKDEVFIFQFFHHHRWCFTWSETHARRKTKHFFASDTYLLNIFQFFYLTWKIVVERKIQVKNVDDEFLWFLVFMFSWSLYKAERKFFHQNKISQIIIIN